MGVTRVRTHGSKCAHTPMYCFKLTGPVKGDKGQGMGDRATLTQWHRATEQAGLYVLHHAHCMTGKVLAMVYGSCNIFCSL